MGCRVVRSGGIWHNGMSGFEANGWGKDRKGELTPSGKIDQWAARAVRDLCCGPIARVLSVTLRGSLCEHCGLGQGAAGDREAKSDLELFPPIYPVSWPTGDLR